MYSYESQQTSDSYNNERQASSQISNTDEVFLKKMYKLKQCSIFFIDIVLKPVNNKQSGLFVKGALDIVIKSLWWIVRRDIFHSLSTVSHYEELEYKQRFFAAI